jgi:hypothetical protein
MENPLNTFLLTAFGSMVTATVATVVADSPKRPIESCVEAYYSQKYRGQEKAVITFKSCMKKNFPGTFTEIREKYKTVSKEESS